jgi:hypothetical protein
MSEEIVYRIEFKTPGDQWRDMKGGRYAEYEKEEAIERVMELNKGRTRGYQYRLVEGRGRVIYG